jgi:hypothetical protein
MVIKLIMLIIITKIIIIIKIIEYNNLYLMINLNSILTSPTNNKDKYVYS